MSNEVFSYLIWFVNSFLAVSLLTPLLRMAAHRMGIVDHPGGQSYKWHDQPTAYLGGAAIVFAFIVAAASGQTPHSQVFVILLGALACGAVGAWDDWRTVGVWPKLSAPVLAAIALWVVDIRVGLTGISGVDLLLTVIWVAAVTHAVNIIDNMDGVATGLAAVSALAFFAIAVTHNETRIALMAASLVGGCLAFLPFNFRPATVFLGDAGSLSLGFVLAALGLANDLPGSPGIARAFVPSLVLGIPLLNLLLVIVSRRRGGRPVTVGGRDGMAHRLITLGLNKHQAALVFWVAGAAAGAAGFLASVTGTTALIFIVTATAVVTVTGIVLFERVPLHLQPHPIRTSAVPEGLALESEIEGAKTALASSVPELADREAAGKDQE